MKKLNVFLMCLIIISTVFVPVIVATETVNVTITGYRNYDYALSVVELVNIQRANNNLSVLQYDSALTEAAMKRAEELVLNFSHTRANGKSWYTVISKANGENVALGYDDADSVVNGWMNSSGHRANILKSNYNSIGIGCYTQGDTTYWVQIFSKSTSTEEPTQTGVTEEYKTEVEVSEDILGELIVEFSDEDYTLTAGDSASVTQVSVTNGSLGDIGYAYALIENTDCTFSSSDEAVLTIDENGNIKAISQGEATVTVALGSSSKEYTFTVLKNEEQDSIMEEDKKDEVADEEKSVEDDNNANENVEKKDEDSDSDETIILGDLNGDGMVNSVDAAMVLDAFKNGDVTEEKLAAGDMNRDGILNSIDASMILDLYKSK